MKIKTDLKAGILGGCSVVSNQYGKCKKIVCPYPPFEFPCGQKYRATRYGPGYRDVLGEDADDSR